MITAAGDGSVRLWSDEGRLVSALPGQESAVLEIAFSSDGSMFATSQDDGPVRVFVTEFDDLLDLVDRRVTREFTAEERERYGELLGTER